MRNRLNILLYTVVVLTFSTSCGRKKVIKGLVPYEWEIENLKGITYQIDSSMFSDLMIEKKGWFDSLGKHRTNFLDSLLFSERYALFASRSFPSGTTGYVVLNPGLPESFFTMELLIFDSSRKFITTSKLASKSVDAGGPEYDSKSYFVNDSTWYKIATRQFWLDEVELRKLPRTLKDILIDSNVLHRTGEITSRTIYESRITYKYRNQDGRVDSSIVSEMNHAPDTVGQIPTILIGQNFVNQQ